MQSSDNIVKVMRLITQKCHVVESVVNFVINPPSKFKINNMAEVLQRESLNTTSK